MADPLASIFLGSHRELADFLELRHGSSQVSGIFGTQGFKASSPIDLSTGFDDYNRTGQEKAWKTILETQPLLIFLTPRYVPWKDTENHYAKVNSTKERLRQQYKPQLQFCVQVMKYQLQNKRFFILDGPEYSQLWCQKEIQVMVPRCSWNVIFFSEGIKGTSWSQGFLHNLPDSCASAFMGTCPRVRPTRLAQELAYRPVYSPTFMQELARSLSDLARPANMPALLATDGNVLVDRLDLASPNVDEAKDLLQWTTKDHQYIRPIEVPKLETVAAFAATPRGYKVHDPHVKYMMALINSLPKGKELPLHTTYSRQAEELGRLVRPLRQRFLPLCEFHYCNILRGTLGTQFPALTVDDPAYVVMWKKNGQAKQLFIVSVASLRVNDQFDVTKWSYVLFWSEFKHSKDKDSTDMDLDDPNTTSTAPDQGPPSRPTPPEPMDIASPQDPVLPQAPVDHPIPQPTATEPEPPTIHMDPGIHTRLQLDLRYRQKE